MKKSTAFIRSVALTAALFLAVSIFPMDALTEQIFSDWFSVDTEPAPAWEQVLEAANADYTIRVASDKKANLPDSTKLAAKEITDTAPYLDQITDLLQIGADHLPAPV